MLLSRQIRTGDIHDAGSCGSILCKGLTRKGSEVSLVGRVYLLVLLAAAPAFGLQLYQDLEQRTAGERQVGQEALRLVRFASSELDKVLEGARAFLVAVAANPDVQAGDSAGCSRYFQGLGAPFPPIRGAI